MSKRKLYCRGNCGNECKDGFCPSCSDIEKYNRRQISQAFYSPEDSRKILDGLIDLEQMAFWIIAMLMVAVVLVQYYCV